jgi:hydrogenase maturation protease
MSGKVTIIGYGNPLRGDDALGWHAARALAGKVERYREAGRQIGDFAAADLEVLVLQQLTPEIAEEIAQAELVIFIDAGCGQYPGQWSCETVRPRSIPPGPTTHHFCPGNLLALAEALYGRIPGRALILTVGGESFGHGQPLSPALSRVLKELPEVVTAIIANCSRFGPLSNAPRFQAELDERSRHPAAGLGAWK